ncbi:hypothetical protein P9112_001596 [Eukaryota sp. TZLM1-RC]
MNLFLTVFFPPLLKLSFIKTDSPKAPEFVQSLNNKLLQALLNIEKTAFQLDDTELTIIIENLLLKYPHIFSKIAGPQRYKYEPMRLKFPDETKIVFKKAHYLPPDKLKIAQEEFDTLSGNGFAVPYHGPFVSPIYLVCVPKIAFRPTGNYSEHKGINDLTKLVPADVPRITDVCKFLLFAEYIIV